MDKTKYNKLTVLASSLLTDNLIEIWRNFTKFWRFVRKKFIKI